MKDDTTCNGIPKPATTTITDFPMNHFRQCLVLLRQAAISIPKKSIHLYIHQMPFWWEILPSKAGSSRCISYLTASIQQSALCVLAANYGTKQTTVCTENKLSPYFHGALSVSHVPWQNIVVCLFHRKKRTNFITFSFTCIVFSSNATFLARLFSLSSVEYTRSRVMGPLICILLCVFGGKFGKTHHIYNGWGEKLT